MELYKLNLNQVLNFGRHEGSRLIAVALADRRYLYWATMERVIALSSAAMHLLQPLFCGTESQRTFTYHELKQRYNVSDEEIGEVEQDSRINRAILRARTDHEACVRRMY